MKQTIKDKIDTVFAEVNSQRTPGAALAVIQQGQVSYATGYGSANLEINTPITSKTIFDIGSTSKQFTAFAILLLARQGKLSLDDEVQKFFPDCVRYAAPLTVRHLVQHTGGVRDYLNLMHIMGLPHSNEYPSDHLIRLLERQRHLEFSPGERWRYSNGGYVLLAQIIARVSGLPYEQFVAEQLLKPLGMNQSKLEGGFHSVIQNRAMPYFQLPDGSYENAASLFSILGDGSLQTNVEDLALWVQNFEHNIIGRYGQDFIDEAFTSGMLNNGQLHGYGFGLFSSQYLGQRMIGHAGSWAGYLAELIFFPASNLGVICLSNCSSFDPTAAARSVAAIVLRNGNALGAQPLETTATATPNALAESTDELGHLTGTYREANNGAVWRFLVEPDGIKLSLSQMSFALVATAPNCFQTRDAQVLVQIQFIGPGKATVQAGEDKPIVCERVEAITYSETQLQDFCGQFYSEELDFTCHLLIHQASLLMRRGFGVDAPLAAVAQDCFEADGIVVDFERNALGKVIGFAVVWAADVPGVAFNRL
jgi:CubicO group peptidase (beta-lactamase class C family)